MTGNSIVEVPFRDGISQTIGSSGWRTIPPPAADTVATIGVYGCSFTYGAGLADNETYCALLQDAFPDVEILNRGVGGYGTVQNYLQFCQDLSNGRVQGAIFGVISDHRYRNTPHPQRMQQFLKMQWYKQGVEHVPVVEQRRQGGINIRYVEIWQRSLMRRDFDTFLPSDSMLDNATIAMFDAITERAHQQDIPVTFALLDSLDPKFNSVVSQRIEGVWDISTPFDAQHTFLPGNPHPNVKANRIFAERLGPPMAQILSHVRKHAH